MRIRAGVGSEHVKRRVAVDKHEVAGLESDLDVVALIRGDLVDEVEQLDVGVLEGRDTGAGVRGLDVGTHVTHAQPTADVAGERQ
jgi:hypothetical protein